MSCKDEVKSRGRKSRVKEGVWKDRKGGRERDRDCVCEKGEDRKRTGVDANLDREVLLLQAPGQEQEQEQ